jgi:hypothetical protein
VPVVKIEEHAFYKRPCFAHAGFNRMDGTQAVPEYTVPILGLCKNQFPPGNLAIIPDKRIGIRMNVSGYLFDFPFGDKRSAVPVAAVTASLAFKNIVRFHII